MGIKEVELKTYQGTHKSKLLSKTKHYFLSPTGLGLHSASIPKSLCQVVVSTLWS